METVPLWFTIVIVVLIQLLWTFVIRTFPEVLGAAFIKRIEHEYDLKFARAKAELDSNFSTLRTSVDFLLAGQSELRVKIIASVEPLWATIIEIKKEFSNAIFLDSVLTAEEINDAFEYENHNTFTKAVEEYKNQMRITEKMERANAMNTDMARLFVGDRLWLIFFIIRAVHGRFSYLIHKSFVNEKYCDWRKDQGIDSLLKVVVQDNILKSAKTKKIGGLQFIISHLEAEFLKEAARVMSGSQGFADSLSDVQATLLYESKRVANQIDSV